MCNGKGDSSLGTAQGRQGAGRINTGTSAAQTKEEEEADDSVDEHGRESPGETLQRIRLLLRLGAEIRVAQGAAGAVVATRSDARVFALVLCVAAGSQSTFHGGRPLAFASHHLCTRHRMNCLSRPSVGYIQIGGPSPRMNLSCCCCRPPFSQNSDRSQPQRLLPGRARYRICIVQFRACAFSRLDGVRRGGSGGVEV